MEEAFACLACHLMQAKQLNQTHRNSDGKEEVLRVLPRHGGRQVKSPATASSNQQIFLKQDEVGNACVERGYQQAHAQAGDFQGHKNIVGSSPPALNTTKAQRTPQLISKKTVFLHARIQTASSARRNDF